MSARRQLIEAQRAGYAAGMRAVARGKWTPARQKIAKRQAVKVYPLTEERQRIISTGASEFKVEGGQLISRCILSYVPDSAKQWRVAKLQRGLLHQLLELLDNPTEIVEVE